MSNDENNGAFVQPPLLDPPVISESMLNRGLRTEDGFEFPSGDAYALYRDPEGRQAVLDASVSSLPTVTAGDKVELARPLKDRVNPGQHWYLPGYGVSIPAEAPLFRCEEADVPTSSGDRIWKGRIDLSYATEKRVDEEAWQSFAGERENATLEPAPAELDRVELRVPHFKDGGTLTTKSFQGSIDADANRVSFDLKGDALRMAYQSLSDPADERAKRAAVVFYTAFKGWDRLTPEEESILTDPVALTGTGMAGGIGPTSTDTGTSGDSPDSRSDSTDSNPLSVHARLAEGVRHEFTDLSLGDYFDTPPAVFASVQTFNGGNPVGVRLRNRAATSVTAMLEEETSKDEETKHRAETLGYLALPTGPLFDASGTRIGEVGVDEVSQPDPDHWYKFDAENRYQQPVAFAQILTYNGREPCHVRLRSVSDGSAGGFEYQIEEWEYLNGKHIREKIAVLLVEAGRHELADGSILEVGTVRTNHVWKQVGFDPLPSSGFPVVVSQTQTTEGGEAVVTRHRNVTNGKFDVRLQEESASSGEHRTETIGYAAVDTAPPKYARQRFVVEEPVYVGFPCEDHKHAYVHTHDGHEVTFACSAPWSSDGTPGKQYERLAPDWLADSQTLLESLDTPDTFVLVPGSFVVTRDRESRAPAMMLLQAPDPTGNSSLVQFKFTVGPDLTPFERQLLEQHLYDETRRVDGVPQVPTLRLPAETLSLGGSFEWTDEQAASVNYAPSGDGYTVTVSYERLSRAALVIETLTAEQGQLSGQLEFPIAEDLMAGSTLTLDLNRTTGPVLETGLENGTVTLTNRCESPVTVTKLLGYTEGEQGHEVVELDSERSLEPGAGTEFEGILPSSYADVAVHYRIDEDPSKSLTERKIDVSRLTVKLSVTSNLNPRARNIEKLVVEVEFPAANENDSCVLVPSSNGFADVSQVLTFRLPLDQYLRPENRRVNYRVTVSYTDSRGDHVSDWLEYELGESAILNITSDAIGLEDI